MSYGDITTSESGVSWTRWTPARSQVNGFLSDVTEHEGSGGCVSGEEVH